MREPRALRLVLAVRGAESLALVTARHAFAVLVVGDAAPVAHHGIVVVGANVGPALAFHRREGIAVASARYMHVPSALRLLWEETTDPVVIFGHGGAHVHPNVAEWVSRMNARDQQVIVVGPQSAGCVYVPRGVVVDVHPDEVSP